MKDDVVEDSNRFNSEMLLLARQSRGLSQSSLARALGFSQGKISRIEAGINTPSREDISRISDVLRYPENFFQYTGEIYGAGGDGIYHRARRKVKVSILNKSYAESEIRRIHIEKLLRSVDVGDANFPSYDPDEFDGSVERIASMVRAAWNLPPGPVRNVVHVVESSGGVVFLCKFNTQHIDGFSKRILTLPSLFFLNIDMPPDRLRWTLAHEIGHMVMHYKSLEPDNEEEANRFASEFLTPEREIKRQLTNLTIEKLARLKQYWKVSMQALIMRAYSLGNLTDRQLRSWFMRLSSHGYRVREPIELDPPFEEPRLIKAIIQFHKEELKYSDESIMQMLAINSDEYHHWYGDGLPYLRLVK